MTTNADEFRRAERVMPGGVSSPVRAFRAVGGDPRVIRSAKGAWLTDVEGRRYVDYIGAWGAAILGHAHAGVCRAIAGAARRGTAIGTCTRGESRLAEAIVESIPGVEQVRFANSGTEAVMTAVRLARAATGRRLIVKCDGCYHGHADATLVRSGSGVATLGLPESPGVSQEAARETIVVPFNDLGAVRAAFDRHPGAIAALVIEPVAGNMGVVPPRDGYLEGLRALASERAALLVFDEVMTGFRIARGGAVERLGVRPDLVTLGKVIGGGCPVGAVAGAAHLMKMLAPVGPVYAAGTFSGNPLTMAAGRAALRRLDRESYATLERLSARLEAGIVAGLRDAGNSGCVQRVGSMLTLFFGVDRVDSMADARAADHARFAAFFQAMLARGVHLPPSGYEAWFVSLAHNEDVIDRTIAACADALHSLRRCEDRVAVQH